MTELPTHGVTRRELGHFVQPAPVLARELLPLVHKNWSPATASATSSVTCHDRSVTYVPGFDCYLCARLFNGATSLAAKISLPPDAVSCRVDALPDVVQAANHNVEAAQDLEHGDRVENRAPILTLNS